MLNYKKNNMPLYLVLAIFCLLHLPNFFAATFSHVRFWEQADRAAISRNFAQESMRFFYPRIDLRGNASGIEGTEFPLYHYIVALAYKATRTTWTGFGKLLSLISACLALCYLYQLALVDFPAMAGRPLLSFVFLATAALVPFFFRFSVLFLPDMFALALALAAFYYFYRYQQCNYKTGYLCVSALALCIACLSRPYYGFFGLPYLTHFIAGCRYNRKEAVKIAAASVLLLLPFGLWYHAWVPYLDKTYKVGGYFFMGSPLWSNCQQILAHPFDYLLSLLKVIAGFYMGWVLLPFFVGGLFVMVGRPNAAHDHAITKRFLWIALLALVAVPCLAGTWLFKQRYYLGALYPAIVFVSALSMFALIEQFGRRVMFLLVVVFLSLYVGSIFSYTVPQRICMSERVRQKLLQGVGKNDLVVTVSPQAGNPIYLYLLGRKGWALGYQDNNRVSFKALNVLRDKGAKYVLFVNYPKKHQPNVYKMLPLK